MVTSLRDMVTTTVNAMVIPHTSPKRKSGSVLWSPQRSPMVTSLRVMVTAMVIRTGWRRLIGSPKLLIIFHKRANKYRSLLRKMTYKDKGSYESSPPCMIIPRIMTKWKVSLSAMVSEEINFSESLAPNEFDFIDDIKLRGFFSWRRHPRNFENVTLVARWTKQFRGLWRFVWLLSSLQKRCFSTQEFTRFLSTVSSQHRAMKWCCAICISRGFI